ncbi:FAD-binding oxidoreductase [Curtobacterium ammoniigenes]|uniref:FAD-binding oxidoreductase n=1 Tax=Curtobacterium ammoniigenes TaxID=395387 RepID=UPI0008311D23|nr:FAD-binding oxidoreductase [Curtobacterium ammoniigenes]
MTRVPVSSWGRLRADPHEVVVLRDRQSAREAVVASGRPGLAAGMERSYGDVSTNAAGTLWDTRGLDKLIAFDEETGVLRCEAGVLLRDIQELFSGRGWMLAVAPGTEWVTVGGAIANDVHGKNHHRVGSFGNHVVGITLLRTDGTVIECGPDTEPEWFAATVGGLGLTGVILDARIRLRRVPGPWYATERVVFETLDEFFAITAASADWDSSVAWIDITTDGGRRGVVTRANPVAAADRPLPADRRRAVPVTPPFSGVNRATLPLLNRAYYRAQRAAAGHAIEHYRQFFAPLDAIGDWNRLYGPQGFYQYQSLVPPEHAADATRSMLAEVSASGLGSFLGVLKTMGTIPSVGLLSFPAPGVSFALDFPAGAPGTLELFARLDAIVMAAGGRLYPAKDARMPRSMFAAGYPRAAAFAAFRDPGISSDLSRRLLGS